MISATKDMAESRTHSASSPNGLSSEAASIPSRSVLYLASYTAAILGTVLMSMTPVSVTLALRMADIDPAHKNDSFGWAIVIGNMVQLFVSPLAGQLSDATTSRWGMRKPWIVGGMLGGTAVAFVLVNAHSVGATLAAWGVMAFLLGLMMTPLFAVINDQFPPNQHGLVSGLCGSTPLVGVLIGSWLVNVMPASAFYEFVVPTGLGGLLVLQFVLLLKDKIHAGSATNRVNFRAFVRSFQFNPRANPSFTWFLVVVILIFIGAITLQDYMVYLLQDTVRVPVAELSHWVFLAFLVANAAGSGFSVIGGMISDKIGRRKPVYATGTALMAVGLLAQGLSHGKVGFFVATFVAGVGFGLLNGLTWALAVESSGDNDNMARDMGLVNMALVIPGLMVPLIARFAHTENGYFTMYLVCAILAITAIPAMMKIRNVR